MMSGKIREGTPLVKPALLFFSVVLISILHYKTTAGGDLLLHEISQKLYYLPIVYAAYVFGLRGSLILSLMSGGVYFLHISGHWHGTQPEILNQYAEVFMFQVVGLVTGLLARAEKKQRVRFEKASAKLAIAYEELKSTVNLLIRADRLKSVGEMAAAIVHEIRNPLGAIKGAAEIIEKDIPLESPRRKFLVVIEKEVDRLNRLVLEFLNFAKPRQPHKAPANLNSLIQSVVTLLAKEAAKKEVELAVQLDEQLPTLWVDADQIRQVLVNLILNAIQAMPNGGKIEIKSFRLGEEVELSVRDFGVGIDATIKDKIFDPFFTTKSEGSGLGLSIAYQLVKQHQGEISIAEIVGPGTLFLVRLPIAPQAVASELMRVEESLSK
ncbi:MAG: sensor histidine kinase [Acidobacteria bacterium]|nr:sensor histidine kinase [Acidobacteriota bacterium]